MIDLIVFGGTTEGRRLAALLRNKELRALVCVATEYGDKLLHAGGSISVLTGRLDAAGMQKLFIEHTPRCVIDATHPYAQEVSRNIKSSCVHCGIRYLRVCRESLTGEGCVQLADMDALIAYLGDKHGVIFCALGAKEAEVLARVKGYQERIWLRILPSADGLNRCIAAGFPAAHIICMQGPFSKELNAAMFTATGASILVTKESGAIGGYVEKVEAARECGMEIVVLRRPDNESGLLMAELEAMITEGAI